MRIFFICLLLFLIHETKAQFIEDFNDGDFTSNPVWSGDTTKFQVIAGKLQSFNTIANDIFSLSTPSSKATTAQWEWYVNLAFSTSSANYTDVFLISDNVNLQASLQGYFVRIGNTDDEIALYRMDGTSATKIIDGLNQRCGASNNIFKVKVIRTINNDWLLSDDNTGTGNNYYFEGTTIDNTYSTGSYFGVLIKQSTSTFSNKHFFDDIVVGDIVIDTILPVISSAIVISATTLDLKFNEPVTQLSCETILNYIVNNSIGNPITAQRDIADLSLVHLSFSSSFTPSKINTITVNNVLDLNNNAIASAAAIQFAFPDTARPGDIVINEILFNPFTGGSDFVELFNHSSKVVDLSKLQIANTSLSTGVIDVASTISDKQRLFYPGDYICITEDPNNIMSRYTVMDPNAILDIGDLPSYNDDEGECVLLDASLNTIDRFHYLDNYHFPLLNDKEGVSLERISPDRVTQDSSNWHSASTGSGYATPGYKNSQYSVSSSDGSEIKIDPEIFSPDNDGYYDIVNIYYQFEKSGYTANVKIYSSQGMPVIELVKSELLGTEEGTWSWDGIDKDHQKAAVGIYVIYIEAFSSTGDVKKIKKTCVLAARL